MTFLSSFHMNIKKIERESTARRRLSHALKSVQQKLADLMRKHILNALGENVAGKHNP